MPSCLLNIGPDRKDPDHIHEVPVNCGSLNRIALIVIQTASAIGYDNNEENQAREYMEGMHTCHHEEDCPGWAVIACQSIMEGKRPFHQDDTQQEAQT